MNLDTYYPYINAVLRIVCVCVFFFLLLIRSPSSYGSVTVTSTGLKLTADAAQFGRSFTYGLEYMARLQYFPSDPHLCANSKVTNSDSLLDDSTDIPVSKMTNKNYPSFLSDMFDDDLQNNNKNVFQELKVQELKEQNANKIIVPHDGSPVVILALRGQCTYEEKTLAATKLVPEGVVHFVIVYDDRPESDLIKMAKDGNVDASILDKIGSMFVSQESGFQLKRIIDWQPEDQKLNGGPHVLLSSHSHFFLSFQTTFAKWAAILCLSFVCAASCLCILGNETYIPDSQVVVNEGTNPGRYRHGLRLLNEDEVKDLPEVEFGTAELVSQDVEKGSSGSKEKDRTTFRKSDNKDKKKKEANPVSEEEHTTDPESLIKSDSSQSSKTGEFMEGAKVTAIEVGHAASRCTTVEYYHSTSCSICIEDYEPGELIRVLPCGHAFHSECILPWLTDRSPTCPLCKALFEVTREGDVVEPTNEEGEDDNASQQSLRTRAMNAFGMNPPGMPPSSDNNTDSNATEQQATSTSSPAGGRSVRDRFSRLFRRPGSSTSTPTIVNTANANATAQTLGLEQPLLGRNEI